MQNWDFNCPQFYDFEAGLQNDSPNDTWFENLNRNEKREPPINRKMFGPRMATPKLRPPPISENSPHVNTKRPVKTDDKKLEELCLIPLRKSASLCSIDCAIEELETPKEKNVRTLNRRSFSEDCIKIKKKIYPTTPKCLKRTLHNIKSKKAKTSEELELERISTLQNELLQHLRLNEVNLQRIKMNKAPVAIKNFNNCHKLLKVKETKDLNIPDQQFAGVKSLLRKSSKLGEEKSVEKTKASQQNTRMKLETLNAALHSKNTKPEIPSNVLRDLNSNKDSGTVLQKKVRFGLYQAHSGLKFLPNQGKTTVHPFSFDSSYASSQSVSFCSKDSCKVFPSSVNRSHLVNKENL